MGRPGIRGGGQVNEESLYLKRIEYTTPYDLGRLAAATEEPRTVEYYRSIHYNASIDPDA